MKKHAKKFEVIALVKQGRTVIEAAHEVGIDRATPYVWKRRDRDFARSLHEAQLMAQAAAKIGQRRFANSEGG